MGPGARELLPRKAPQLLPNSGVYTGPHFGDPQILYVLCPHFQAGRDGIFCQLGAGTVPDWRPECPLLTSLLMVWP